MKQNNFNRPFPGCCVQSSLIFFKHLYWFNPPKLNLKVRRLAVVPLYKIWICKIVKYLSALKPYWLLNDRRGNIFNFSIFLREDRFPIDILLKIIPNSKLHFHSKLSSKVSIFKTVPSKTFQNAAVGAKSIFKMSI